MEEAFFNKDFWRQLVAVLAGAFLGFGLALLTGFILWLWRRRVLARMTRRIVVTETIDNLRALRKIHSLSKRMRDENFKDVRFSTLRPRAAILQQFMTAESLDALSEGERTFLAVTVPQLAYLSERYEDYERLFSNPLTAIRSVRTQAGDEVPYRAWETDRFLLDVTMLGTNLLDLLILACHRAKGQLAEERSREIASKLRAIRFGHTTNFRRAFRTSMVKEAQSLEPDKWLVVWEHDWPECPMRVIELRPTQD